MTNPLIARLEEAKPDECWAAMAPDDAIPPNFIHGATAQMYAHQVREYMGDAWKHAREDHKKGWRRAYRAGWRVVRVTVSPSLKAIAAAEETA